MGWFKSVCLGFDQFINAVAGGNPDTSISARIGYHNYHLPSSYWTTLGKIVDVTFYPLDGKNHCAVAYLTDSTESYKESVDTFEKVVLASITTVSCVLLIIPIYLLALCNRIFSR